MSEQTGCVVQQGTRRYRLCHNCLTETSLEGVPEGVDAEHCPASSGGSKHSRWALEDDQKSDGGAVEEEEPSSTLTE